MGAIQTLYEEERFEKVSLAHRPRPKAQLANLIYQVRPLQHDS